MEHKIVSNYIHNDELRHALNEMTKKTFSFSFEGWVTNGYCEEQYIPYSIFKDGKLISNISVNIMNYTLFGEQKNFIQLGTVMTDKAYRKQGLAREIMEQVLETYKDSDGIYLFANDSAINFYPKFGFQEAKLYKFTMDGIREPQNGTFEKVNPEDKGWKEKYLEYARSAVINSGFEMQNSGVLLFWTSELEDLYYSKELDCFVSAWQNGKELILNQIVAKHEVKVMDVIRNWNSELKQVVLNFTPVKDEIQLFEIAECKVEDCTLYYIGEQLECIDKEQLAFSLFSHA